MTDLQCVHCATFLPTCWCFSDVSGTEGLLCRGDGLLRFCKIWGAEHLWSSILDPCERENYEPLFTSNSVRTDQITWNASWKHLLYLQSVRWPTWALAITLHRLPASASEAEFDFAFPFCIPGNADRESRWSSSRLPCELANREKNFSGSASGKVKTVTDV